MFAVSLVMVEKKVLLLSLLSFVCARVFLPEDKGCLKESQKSFHPVSSDVWQLLCIDLHLTQVITSRSDERAIYSTSNPPKCQNIRFPTEDILLCYQTEITELKQPN